MKKIIFLFFILTLLSCGKNESLETEKDFVIDIHSNTGNIVNNNSGSEIETGEIIESVKENIPKIKIYSPVYTLTGETLSGTSKVEVVFSGSTKKDNYFLKEFKTGDKEFITNLRLDYGNIEKGGNNYEVKFYDEKDEIIGNKKYLIEADYEEVKVNDNLSIFTQKYAIDNNVIESCNNYYLNNISKTYIKDKGKIKELDGCYSFSKSNLTYIELKNIKINNNDGIRNMIADIYDIDGKILVKNFKINEMDGFFIPFYKDNKLIWNEGRGDICAGSYVSSIFDIKTSIIKKYNFSNNSCFVDSKNDIIIGWEGGWNNWEENKNKKRFVIFEEIKEKINHYSIFSISKGDFRKNYIYDSKLKLNYEKVDFYEEKETYSMKLGDKDFLVNFTELKEKMSFLYGGGYDNENFDYGIYLKKQSNNYIINFDKIEPNMGGTDKIVKYIGITSCSSNNSKIYDKEYNLTPDENGNYKYNISEKLNNKCDIPYKINVYYEDGSKETGEYYVLFDY